MARYSSDSDDDRRSREKRSKKSRKRDRRSRSRSRDRRRRSRSRSRSSRSHRRRSRSRSVDRRSSDDSHYRSKKSRSDRDRRSRSPSSSRTSEERQKDKRDKDAGAVEKTKQRIKEALNQAETNDDDLLRAKEKKKLGKEVIPNADAIAEIENDEFVQQNFSSSFKEKQSTVDKSQPDILISSVKATPVVPMNLLIDPSNSEGLFAARVLEDESTKMERWIKKLAATRNKMLATGSIKH